MKPKDVIIDFVNLSFILLVVAFFIFFFIVGNRFDNFIQMLQQLIPVAMFLIIFIIAMKLEKTKARKREFELRLHISSYDKLKSYIIIFSLPILIVVIAWLVDRRIEVSDILLSIIVFLIVFIWKLNLFKNSEMISDGNEYEIVLYLKNRDVLISKIIVYALPIIILITIFFVKKEITRAEIFQAAFVFSAMNIWQYILLRKV